MAERKDPGERQLSIAAALITKAQTTSFPAERESLVLRAYTQLATYLNSLDPQPPSERRRERRFLVDRRARANERSGEPAPREVKARHIASTYRSFLTRRPAVGVNIDVEV
jgi:hypothetical protein